MEKRELLSIGLELAYIIALPVIVLGLAGKWLDERYSTIPLFTLVGIVFAIVSTTFWIYKKFNHKLK